MKLEELQQCCDLYKELEILVDDVAYELGSIHELRTQYLGSFEITDNKEVCIVVGDWEMGDRDNGQFFVSLEDLANPQELYERERAVHASKLLEAERHSDYMKKCQLITVKKRKEQVAAAKILKEAEERNKENS